jgi:hypothetical protein
MLAINSQSSTWENFNTNNAMSRYNVDKINVTSKPGRVSVHGQKWKDNERNSYKIQLIGNGNKFDVVYRSYYGAYKYPNPHASLEVVCRPYSNNIVAKATLAMTSLTFHLSNDHIFLESSAEILKLAKEMLDSWKGYGDMAKKFESMLPSK